MTVSFEDEEAIQSPLRLGMPGDWPVAWGVTLTFEEPHGKTKFALLNECIPEGKMSEITEERWNGSLDK